MRLFENRMLTRIRPKRDEVTGEWRKPHNEKPNDLYCKSNIVRVIKLRIMRWAGHVARMREKRGVCRFRWGNLRERVDLRDRGVDVRIILRWIFERWDMGVWTTSRWLRLGLGGGHL